MTTTTATPLPVKFGRCAVPVGPATGFTPRHSRNRTAVTSHHPPMADRRLSMHEHNTDTDSVNYLLAKTSSFSADRNLPVGKSPVGPARRIRRRPLLRAWFITQVPKSDRRLLTSSHEALAGVVRS
jgi:hypothetical protein